MTMFTFKNKPVKGADLLVYIIGNLVALPLAFWGLTIVGQAMTGEVFGGYAFALFVATTGAIVTLD